MSSATSALSNIVKKASKSKNESAKGSKRGRLGNKPSHQRYNSENRQLKNKIKRMRRHIRRFPLDAQAVLLLKEIG